MSMKGLDGEELRDLILTVGTHSKARPLSPAEAADLIAKAMRAGTSRKECAEAVQLNDSTMVSRILSIRALEPAVRVLVDWGFAPATVSFSSAVEVARFRPDEQEAVAKAIIEFRMNRHEVKSLVQLRERSGRPVTECIEEIIGSRKVTITEHLVLGAVIDEDLRAVLRQMHQAERDVVLREILKEAGLGRFACRLGPTNFALAIGSDPTVPQPGGVDLETFINSRLNGKLLGHV